MEWIIDRFEENFAVVGCGDMYFNIPKNALPEEASEGSIIKLEINISETENRAENLKNRLNNLFGE